MSIIQNKRVFFKLVVESFLVVLGVLLLFLFGRAVFCDTHINRGQESQIHIFINDNDSIITTLQKDVEHLSSMIEAMSADTLVIEMRHPK